MICSAPFQLAVHSPLFSCEEPDLHDGPHSSLESTLWAGGEIRREGETASDAVRRAAALLDES